MIPVFEICKGALLEAGGGGAEGEVGELILISQSKTQGIKSL